MIHIKPQTSANSVLKSVFLSELFYATGGVDEFLLAGEKGMAVGANFDVDGARRRAGFYGMAAGARDGHILIFWVNPGFHNILYLRETFL